MPIEQTRYETHHDPQPSPGIARAESLLRERKRPGPQFDTAWEDATNAVAASDRVALKWARDVPRDAYENRSGGPLALAALEV